METQARRNEVLVGTAAWTIPALAKPFFDDAGTHLERYARVLTGVEINTSFYRDHKASTYEKWARSVPDHFRFAVKLSKIFTHENQLNVDETELAANLSGIQQLGEKLSVILIQLPPKLAFKENVARDFFEKLRRAYRGSAVLEPRHKTWTSPEAAALLKDFAVGKVMADPEPCPTDENFQLAGPSLYIRWHGTPEIYKSRYSQESLAVLNENLQALVAKKRFESIWVIFDNTTLGYATVNALEFQDLISPQKTPNLKQQGVQCSESKSLRNGMTGSPNLL